MKRKLREELILLATDIITSREEMDIPRLYTRSQRLYEKLAVLKLIEEKLQHVEIDVSKSEMASKFESIASAVINENRMVPESNPHEEDIIIPGIDTIKHMVSEMPGGEELEEVLEKFLSQNDFIKNDKEILTPDIPEKTGMTDKKSLNDTLSAREISVGLNDRLAFVKHLFNDSTEDFNRILSQLNTIESQQRSVEFIEKMVKPEYGNWKGKEEFEARFMALIERRFA
ncbi:hypothetical protein ACT6NV_07105 [Robiginitalea sp. IMCC44478]|uniref:hypothetical protein n=1 Tax=Robiginitalea sp. IMCC44478 TaxID=3459122 RepID=UPI0040439322